MKTEASPTTTGANRGTKTDFAPISAKDSLHRMLVDGLPGMAGLVRADRARTVEYASAGAARLLGFNPGPKSFSLAALIHPDDRESVLELIHEAIAHKQAFAVEYRLRHATGSWRNVWEQGQPAPHGPQLASLSHITDVTERRQREQARLEVELRLLQNQKFHALNHLAAGVAHEFNNLIAGILGSAELLAMDMPDGHPSHDTLKQIFEASNHARDFVHKLRGLGQRPVPEFKPVRVQTVIEECLQILRTIIPPKVEIHTQVDPDCPKVMADAAQIHQVILDLCLHSWQGLADRRGCINLGLALCPIPPPRGNAANPLRPGPHVCITVKDNSHGLEKSARDHIFHPFRSRRTGGTKIGLELFLVRETIHGHHGEIILESEPGHGQAFHIYLPIGLDDK